MRNNGDTLLNRPIATNPYNVSQTNIRLKYKISDLLRLLYLSCLCTAMQGSDLEGVTSCRVWGWCLKTKALHIDILAVKTLTAIGIGR